VHNANLAALLRYRPRPVPCGIVVLKAGGGAGTVSRLCRHLARLYRTVEVRTLPGTHWNLLDRPNAGRLAEEMRRVLSERLVRGDGS
jgi:phthiocerol/phenolphthiocerol synthesis type-I polyketide synthase E